MRAALGLLVVFLICGGIGYGLAPASPNAGFANAAAVLAFVGLAAVTIERIIEGVFGLLAGPLGEWWPFALARKEFDRFESETNGVLGTVVTQTIDELTAAKAKAGQTQDEINRIQAVIDGIAAEQARLSQRYTEVTTKLAPGSARLARVGEINTEIAKKLNAIHATEQGYVAQATTLLSTASEAADRASLILSSFQDNPARRIASLVLGTSLGMLVAGAVGLNLFVATLVTAEGDKTSLPTIVAGTLGILLSGIVIGLGSAPTHEVVKSLQAYRDGRTGPEVVITPAPATPTTAFAGGLELPTDGRAFEAMPTVVRGVRRTG